MSININFYKNDLPEDLELGNSVAIDCEFMGLHLRRDPLCLIQLSTGKKDAFIVQFDRKNYSAPNVIKILNNPKIKKIFHYARSDISFLKLHLNVDIKNIEDTKIQSKLARSYTDKHGLKDLVKEFIGVDINKQKQSSDFGGSLSEAQLKYCANDVIYLHEINNKLNEILKRESRMELYHECLKFIGTRVNLDLASFKDDIWAH
tara:strand:- start:183 stop:794 length:612 start_codon:yes stop_codon:yes gene_type:complete